MSTLQTVIIVYFTNQLLLSILYLHIHEYTARSIEFDNKQKTNFCTLMRKEFYLLLFIQKNHHQFTIAAQDSSNNFKLTISYFCMLQHLHLFIRRYHSFLSFNINNWSLTKKNNADITLLSWISISNAIW